MAKVTQVGNFKAIIEEVAGSGSANTIANRLLGSYTNTAREIDNPVGKTKSKYNVRAQSTLTLNTAVYNIIQDLNAYRSQIAQKNTTRAKELIKNDEELKFAEGIEQAFNLSLKHTKKTQVGTDASGRKQYEFKETGFKNVNLDKNKLALVLGHYLHGDTLDDISISDINARVSLKKDMKRN